jgi:hypothetical protein
MEQVEEEELAKFDYLGVPTSPLVNIITKALTSFMLEISMQFDKTPTSSCILDTSL